ncbi:MAG: substrate-binding domain-containing protein [Gammaproteobacteria bacterium]|nr:substrate-binding domain-containing protein [Gammaproteobacteria bacterium]
MNLIRLISVVSILACTGSLQAASNDMKGLAFSNPAKQMKMPAGWSTKTVQYDKQINNADLVISFGQQTYPALHKLVENYAKDNNINIVIQSGTCGVSAGKLLRKTLDSGTFCCPPSDRDRLPGLEFHTLAISALSIFVNEKNPLQNISTTEARKIFQGKIRKWNEFAVADSFNSNIRPHIRLHCKKRPGHWTLLLKNQEQFSPLLKEVGVIPDLVAKVGQLENSVSLETPYMVNLYRKEPVKMLKVDGHSPKDIDYVASGKYPFYRTYNMTTWSNGGKQKQAVIKLITYLRQHIEDKHQQYSMVPVSKLKKAGWKFKGSELIAEPNGKKLAYYPPQH